MSFKKNPSSPRNSFYIETEADMSKRKLTWSLENMLALALNFTVSCFGAKVIFVCQFQVTEKELMCVTFAKYLKGIIKYTI